MSRTENSIKNIKYAIMGQAIGLLVSFMARKVFIDFLSSEYLGVDGLFSNILMLLSIADLGIGEAITFSLYKPIADKNEKQILALMNLYKKAYMIIGITILFLGLVTMPLLQYLVNQPLAIPHIKLIYFLYIMNTSMSYFLTYKRSLIIANQKKYIATFYRYSCYVALNIVQMILLVVTRNYIIFLILQVISTVIDNLLVSHKADILYPYLKTKEKGALEESQRKTITQSVKGMIYLKIGGVLVGGTDNILISKLVGIVAVGIYSNYYMVIKALNTILGLIFQSLIASIGNLGVTEDIKKSKFMFDVLDLAGFWIFGFSSVMLFDLFNPLIQLWVGDNYLFSIDIVVSIVISYYLTGRRQSILTYISAYGLYWHGRYRSMVEAIINLVVSIILGIQFGVKGVFIGTIISTICACLIIEPNIIYKHIFDSSVMNYYKRYLKNGLMQIVAALLCYGLCNYIKSVNIAGFFMKFFITVVVYNTIFYIFTFKTKEFEYLKNVFFELIKKKKK